MRCLLIGILHLKIIAEVNMTDKYKDRSSRFSREVKPWKAALYIRLSKEDAERIKGKRVLIADDVISTGESLTALEKLCQEAGGTIACRSAVLAEGEAADREDIVFLEKLPLFPQ